MPNWFVMFVKTGRELKVEKQIKEKFDIDMFYPFTPMLETLYKTAGKVRKETKPMFPGYVFVESDISSHDFIQYTRSMISTSNDIIRLLKYGDENEIAMRDEERSTFLSFFNDDHCFESSSGIIVGDRVIIKSGPLKGWENKVRKIDRHKRIVWIEMDFMGDNRLVSVALEIVEKI